MTFFEFFIILVFTFGIGALFFFGFGRTGPWGSFWTFLLILFLGILLVDVWTEPYGPLVWGVAWLDLFLFGLIFALLLAAASPSRPRRPRESLATEEPASKEEDTAIAVVGGFFWILMLVFLILIVFGLYT